MKPMKPRNIYYNYFASFTEAKLEPAYTALSTLTTQDTTNYLSTVVTWILYWTGAVTFE